MGTSQTVVAPERNGSRTRGAAGTGPAKGTAFRHVVGRSPAIRAAIALGLRVAEHQGTTVLLHGETGTGKELFARGIHYAGASASEPFVAINCAAIPENLLESELFGHERGAFTDARSQKVGLFELAGSGTVFLDEIGELPPNLQPKLLRVLEERSLRRLGGLEERRIACRIIGATNRDLAASVADGQFRGDLYYRLNVFRIDLPPLRMREDDTVLLARLFVDDICREHGLPPRELSPAALELLRGHSWPGNIRELKNVLEQALILAEGPVLGPQHIRVQRRSPGLGERRAQRAGEAQVSPPPAAVTADEEGVIRIPPEGMTWDEAGRALIRATLRRAGGNRALAARMLGLSRPTVLRKIRRYGLERERFEVA